MRKLSRGILPILVICWLAVPVTASMVPQRSVLGNGMVLLTSEQRALPMVSIELLIDAGSRHDAPKQEGLANLMARLLTYGTQRRSALQISETLDFIGAGLSAGCGEDLAWWLSEEPWRPAPPGPPRPPLMLADLPGECATVLRAR